MTLGVGDVVRSSAVMEDGRGAQIINTFDWLITTSGTGGNVGFTEDVEEALSYIYDAIHTAVVDNIGFVRVEFLQRNGLEVVLPIAWTHATANSNASAELPIGTTALIYGRTSRRGTTVRKYLPTFGEDRNDDGEVNAAGLTNMNEFITRWKADQVATNGWEFHAVCWPTIGTGELELTTFVASPNWARQNRRRKGRGS